VKVNAMQLGSKQQMKMNRQLNNMIASNSMLKETFQAPFFIKEHRSIFIE